MAYQKITENGIFYFAAEFDLLLTRSGCQFRYDYSNNELTYAAYSSIACFPYIPREIPLVSAAEEYIRFVDRYFLLIRALSDSLENYLPALWIFTVTEYLETSFHEETSAQHDRSIGRPFNR